MNYFEFFTCFGPFDFPFFSPEVTFLASLSGLAYNGNRENGAILATLATKHQKQHRF